MNFDFSNEQKMLRESARRFLAENCPAARVRTVLDDDARAYDEELWRSVAAQGWLGAAVPEEFGGLGLGYLELCVLAEEMGRSLAPIPFASTLYLFAEALMLAGHSEQKAQLLPKIAAGELIGCLAAAEGAGFQTPAAISATVRSGKLCGVKLPVVDGASADFAVVAAKEGGKLGLFLVDARGAGVTRETVQTLDPTRGAAKLTFEDAACVRLGAAGEGQELLAQLWDRAAVLYAFEQVGGADRCLEMARDYALQRYAFGRVIGSYQAIKHRLVDIYVKNELARSNAYYGAWALNSNAPELPLAAAAARAAASDASWFAAKENIQVHGGVGFTWAVDCHLYFRRSRHLALVAGSPRFWKERVAALLECRNRAAAA